MGTFHCSDPCHVHVEPKAKEYWACKKCKQIFCAACECKAAPDYCKACAFPQPSPAA